MKAIALEPGTTNLTMIDRPAPEIVNGDDVLLDVVQVGICGTDREEAAGGRADAPPGQHQLVIGHEMLGRIAAIGTDVQGLDVGGLALFTVRRECGHCPECNANRADMCLSGDYTERGIKQRDGYETERVVDRARYLIPISDDIAASAVLVEPLTIAEKAIDEAQRIQDARLPGLVRKDGGQSMEGRRALVAGLGPVGLLAAIALRLRGAEVVGLDVVDKGSARAKMVVDLGGTYIDGRTVEPSAIEKTVGRVDFIFEATGVAKLEFELMDALGTNGIYVVTGIASGDRPISLDGADLMRRLVLGNQVLLGSVNASVDHFRAAAKDLQAAQARWPGLAASMITTRVPAADFKKAFAPPGEGEIKTVIEWQPVSSAGQPANGRGH
ncbi:MAG TPA: glucose 1-dehydrogenase [Tepidiformaceae bacterium]|nr:glucose 1-dehydrogenase [Tepidiformaceae bacterium]